MALNRFLVALALGCTLLVAAPADAGDADRGRVWRGNGVLERGCHDYGFRYRIRPGPHEWAAEFFLVGPGREGLGTVVKLTGQGKRGRDSFEVCRPSTRPGRFKIRGKLTVTDGSYEQDVSWVRPARFRLRRP